eukprot:152606_1
MFVISMLLLWMNWSVSWVKLFTYALQVFEFIFDVNLMFRIVQHKRFDDDVLIKSCGIVSIIFVLLPYSLNLGLSTLMKSSISNFWLFCTLIGVSGGLHPSLQLVSSQLEETNVIRALNFLQAWPQLIVEIICLQTLDDISVSVYCALVATIISMVITIIVVVPVIARLSSLCRDIIGCTTVIAVIGIFIAKDISLIIIHACNDCNNALDPYGNIEFVSFNFNVWVVIGSTTHILLSLCFIPQLAIASNVNHYAGVFVCYFCFSISWAIIGLLIHSHMNANTYLDDKCGQNVLAWCIIQIIETCILCIWLCIGWDNDYTMVMPHVEINKERYNQFYNNFSCH